VLTKNFQKSQKTYYYQWRKISKNSENILYFKGKLAALYGKQGERMLTRIHRDNPQALFINKFTTNPFASSLLV
jgi:hypothetical protein